MTKPRSQERGFAMLMSVTFQELQRSGLHGFPVLRFSESRSDLFSGVREAPAGIVAQGAALARHKKTLRPFAA